VGAVTCRMKWRVTFRIISKGNYKNEIVNTYKFCENKIKMLVETTFMQKCGEGTPMFSRRGKSTSVQYLVFNSKRDGDD